MIRTVDRRYMAGHLVFKLANAGRNLRRHDYYWIRLALLAICGSLAATLAASDKTDTLPLFGIQYIEDRDKEYPEWDVPKGYDMDMVFGTYQVDAVRECNKQIAGILDKWAGRHLESLIKVSDEPNRLVKHLALPDYGGIIHLSYRVFEDPPRARFYTEFVDKKGLRKLTTDLGSELNDQYQLVELRKEVSHSMRCLKSI